MSDKTKPKLQRAYDHGKTVTVGMRSGMTTKGALEAMERALSGVPPSYREQPCCGNCTHHLRLLWRHDVPGHFCIQDGSDHSVKNGWEAWRAWAKDHTVSPGGICDQHEPKEN